MVTDSSIKSFSKRVARMLRPKEEKLHPLADLAVMIPELNEISEILDGRLYLSGCMPVTKKNLISLGITGIVCAMTEDEERQNCVTIGGDRKFRRMCVRITDSESNDISVHFRTVTAFISRELKSGGKVLVHCVAGVSRSVSLILAYLMKYHGYSARDAYVMVRSKRTIARPNDSFCLQLGQYEKSSAGRSSLENQFTDYDYADEVISEPVVPVILF